MMVFSTRERALLTRRFMVTLCTASLALQIGCYSYAPVQSTPPAQADRISITINDKGRALLSERVSPLVNRIEGRVISVDSINMVLSVTKVIDLKSGESNWLGEKVSIPREAILLYQSRPFSKPRTIALAGAAIGVFAAIITTISLAVSGSGLKDPPPDPGSQSTKW